MPKATQHRACLAPERTVQGQRLFQLIFVSMREGAYDMRSAGPVAGVRPWKESQAQPVQAPNSLVSKSNPHGMAPRLAGDIPSSLAQCSPAVSPQAALILASESVQKDESSGTLSSHMPI